jgi:hypothetical protein
VVSAGDDRDLGRRDAVHQAVLVVDAARSQPGEVVTE